MRMLFFSLLFFIHITCLAQSSVDLKISQISHGKESIVLSVNELGDATLKYEINNLPIGFKVIPQATYRELLKRFPELRTTSTENCPVKFEQVGKAQFYGCIQSLDKKMQTQFLRWWTLTKNMILR